MKNLIIIIGTVILGTIIANTLVLGDGTSLKTAAAGIMDRGTAIIMNNLTFGGGGVTGNGNSGNGNSAAE